MSNTTSPGFEIPLTPYREHNGRGLRGSITVRGETLQLHVVPPSLDGDSGSDVAKAIAQQQARQIVEDGLRAKYGPGTLRHLTGNQFVWDQYEFTK